MLAWHREHSKCEIVGMAKPYQPPEPSSKRPGKGAAASTLAGINFQLFVPDAKRYMIPRALKNIRQDDQNVQGRARQKTDQRGADLGRRSYFSDRRRPASRRSRSYMAVSTPRHRACHPRRCREDVYKRQMETRGLPR